MPAGQKAKESQRKDKTLEGSDNAATPGYGPWGSLVRQGPVPFVIRLLRPGSYEAAVEKYMRLEQCSRADAQGNMDAYFADPNGWAANKLRARSAGRKDVNYAQMNTDKKQLVLTAVWSVAILILFARICMVQLS